MEIFKTEYKGTTVRLLLEESKGDIIMWSEVNGDPEPHESFNKACHTVAQAIKPLMPVGQWRKITETLNLVQNTDWNTVYWNLK